MDTYKKQKDHIDFEGGDSPDGDNFERDSLAKLKQDPDYFTIAGGLWMIVKASSFPILGMIFHPAYMMINARLLGQVQIDKAFCALPDNQKSVKCITAEKYVAGFGIASSTLAILYLAIGVCFALCLMNLIPQAYGAQNYRLCGAYLNRCIICTLLIFTPLLAPLMFVNYLFDFMKQDPIVNELATTYLRITAPSVVLFFMATGIG